jgi:hypothetical protein
MKVICHFAGASPAQGLWYYRILCENGHADYIWEQQYFKSGEYEMPDELWNEGSGWADLCCDKCGSSYRERTRPGAVVACPACGEPELVPEGAMLEDSNLMEDEE